ncbi:hypothetical protein [Alkaliphilus hydrothermalis]|uniref:Uncharacterized protein n=1 Tax=Alkaliphilus hydrothermalis TaxID=1482730 RepID=A0ABS2NQR7_9FIRM|nr:hypothetical protein [Alkaliphilus hydrothermalis]MBM7615266.1 hypothetical protein [Alkaliphilus hydrothermalis]
MENMKDVKALMEQINQLKDHTDQTKEYLAAIQLLAVDDNNGRIKDRVLASNIDSLNNKISNVNTEIDVLVNRITNNQ